MSETINGKKSPLIFGTLLAGLLGLQGWSLSRIDRNSGLLATVSAVVEAGKRERLDGASRNDDAHNAIMQKLDGLVSRREFDMRSVVVDSKFLGVEVEVKEVQARITKIEAQLVGLDARFVNLETQLQELKNKVDIIRKGSY